jgi:predicted aspartyl protease/cytochrome c-type biogenesis protein CcmH/NrfG
MHGFRLAVAVTAFVVAVSLVIHAAGPQSQSVEIQLQLGDVFFGEGRYQESLEAFKNAVKVASPDQMRQARGGVILSSLRVAEFEGARQEAEKLILESPRAPEALALYGDALWASGLFEQAEAKYQEALATTPEMARGLHGIARSLAARGQFEQAMIKAQAALRLSPRDLEIHHTVGTIYEMTHKFEEAAAAYTNYVNLLPNKDSSYKASWSRAEIRFLRSFGQRVPFEAEPGTDDKIFTVPFKLVNDKVVVRARVNGAREQDFVVDTGSEQTVLTRPTAQRLGVLPITQALSAGVGDVGLRGLQLARIDSLELGDLRLRNIPCLIKNPPLALRDLPTRETESLSPLALGYSMTIDYKSKLITFGKHIPVEPADFELPLRLYRLATVKGTIDGSRQATFIIDTGGEVISISQASANALGKRETGRKIQLRVYGSSGWDTEAFLLPGINLAFDEGIQYRNFSVIVLNLDTPSALLGFQVGGIVGHRFLSNYRVGIDLERSTLRLKKAA